MAFVKARARLVWIVFCTNKMRGVYWNFGDGM